ncbi:TorF family putative porin [Brevundimonas sp.]|uniref:TorF family putative porin n=1 Tax=Brevundimonas sp. TaxID=1871086 RepID=UPI00248A21C5|nr:TorF family putative porin [Brevundimonas sp.]MDI1282414.1 TorF family putative porin [Brevundimonas sp.]
MRIYLASAAAAALLLAAGAASAQSAEVAFNATVTSDYVFRGFSQTDEDPAFQLGADLTAGALYAGAWASNVDFGDDTKAEFDIYGGVRGEAAGYEWDLGLVGYFYADAPSGADYDYLEVKAAASRAIGPATLGLAVYYSPDFFGVDETATYVELNGEWAVTDKISLSGAVGEQYLDVNDDYATWNLGVGYALNDALGVDLRYHDTDVDGVLSESRFVASLSLGF